MGGDEMSTFQPLRRTAPIDPDDLLLDVEEGENEALDDVTIHFGHHGWQDMDEGFDPSF